MENPLEALKAVLEEAPEEVLEVATMRRYRTAQEFEGLTGPKPQLEWIEWVKSIKRSHMETTNTKNSIQRS